MLQFNEIKRDIRKYNFEYFEYEKELWYGYHVTIITTTNHCQFESGDVIVKLEKENGSCTFVIGMLAFKAMRYADFISYINQQLAYNWQENEQE